MYITSLKKLLIFSIIIAVLTFGFGLLFPNLYLSVYPFIVLYFFIITAVEQYIFIKQSEKDSRKFVKITMLTSAVKFLIHLAVLLAYSLSFRQNAKEFILCFAVIYLIYLIYDTAGKMRLSKRKND